MTQMPRIPSGPYSNDQPIDLSRFFSLLLDHKWLIVAVTLVFMLMGFTYGVLATPVYRGDALIQVERRSSVSPLGDVATVIGTEELSTSAEIEILSSRMVLGKVVDKVELDTWVIPKALPLVGDYVQRTGITRPDLTELPWLGRFIERDATWLQEWIAGGGYVWGNERLELGRLEVNPSMRGHPMTLRVLNESRYELLLRGQNLGSGAIGKMMEFDNGNIRLRVATISAPTGAEFNIVKLTEDTAIKMLQSRLSITELGSVVGSTGMLRISLSGTDRQEVERSLNAISETFLIQNVERQSAQADQSLAFLEEQAPNLKEQLVQAENELNEYRVGIDSVDLSSESESVVTRFIEVERRLNELELQEAEISQRFTRNHPSYVSLLRQKRYLEDELASLHERVNQLPAAQQEIVSLTRDVEVNQAIYVNVLNRAQELRVAKAGTIGNVRIIDEASVSGIPIEPKPTVVLVMATVAGVMLSSGGVLLLGLLRRGVERPEQLEELGYPVYATVPHSIEQNRLTKRVKHRREKSGRSVINGILATERPDDTTIEALRGLRTTLHFAMLDASNNRIMVTAPHPGSGKSFICLNLAAVCAQAGKRVLLIDADMRKGELHHAIGGRSVQGLSEMLTGQSEWQHVIRQTDIPGLEYISKGAVPPNPSELLMHDRFSNFLDGFSPEYDLVIIDTPPVLAVTDAAIVGKRAGTTLLVARFQKTSPTHITTTRRRLENAGVVIKACVLNSIENSTAVGYGYCEYEYR